MDKTIVISGASRGIGHHLCKRAQETGYEVIGLARTPPDNVPFEVRACDVGDPEQVDAALRDLRRKESLYGVINAAGVARMNLVVTMEAQAAEKIVRTNLMGTIHVCRTLSRGLVRRGQGRIINFSTIAVPLALKGEAVYAAAKAGVEAFSRTLARELADFGITVNTLAPGPVDTDLIAKVPKDSIDDILSNQMVPRKATPEDIWSIIQFLLSPKADMVTGDVLHVGGV